ncbi:hypothetical protein ACA373_00015 [Erwinia sp. STN24]|uniref:hypothetical protein n=1 Tax=Erwinia sp. STN24 TaxID=3233996 RepID=UPI003522F975
MKTEFNIYDDDTYYFLYVTDEVRIETDGIDGLMIEDRNCNLRKISDPMKYLTIKNEPDEYFNESLINPHIDTLIEAVKVLKVMYGNEFRMNSLK